MKEGFYTYETHSFLFLVSVLQATQRRHGGGGDGSVLHRQHGGAEAAATLLLIHGTTTCKLSMWLSATTVALLHTHTDAASHHCGKFLKL